MRHQLEIAARDHETTLSRTLRSHDVEKDQIRRDYESMMLSIKTEHAQVTAELKGMLADKSESLKEARSELLCSKTAYVSEKNELQTTITNDKYTTDLN